VVYKLVDNEQTGYERRESYEPQTVTEVQPEALIV
jgi:hypothetical protein